MNTQKILIVDDETIIIESLKQWLEGEGFTVLTATNGTDALQLCKFEPISVGVFDIRMPDMDGITLLEQTKKYRPDLAVIMMTAFASVDDAIKCITVGAFDYIIKPFPPEKLSHLIRHIFSMINLREQCRDYQEQRQTIKQLLDGHQHLISDDHFSLTEEKWRRLQKDLQKILQLLR